MDQIPTRRIAARLFWSAFILGGGAVGIAVLLGTGAHDAGAVFVYWAALVALCLAAAAGLLALVSYR